MFFSQPCSGQEVWLSGCQLSSVPWVAMLGIGMCVVEAWGVSPTNPCAGKGLAQLGDPSDPFFFWRQPRLPRMQDDMFVSRLWWERGAGQGCIRREGTSEAAPEAFR